jgi:hypothetical protein
VSDITIPSKTLDSILRELSASKPTQRRTVRSTKLRRRKLKSLHPGNLAAAVSIQQKDLTMLSYVETEFSDYIQNEFVMNRLTTGTHIYGDEVRLEIVPNLPAVLCKILAKTSSKYTLISQSSSRAQIVVEGRGIISCRTNSNSSYVEVLGDQDLIDQVLNTLLADYVEIATTIDWVIGGDSGMTTIPLRAPQGITDSSYPFIEEGVEQFVQDFLASSENVLLLLGIPGSGKSNLIKHIIAKSRKNALITYDPEVMKKDHIFANFIEEDYGSLIMEDADAFLGARTEGNLMMTKFLNVADGIVSMNGKKMIFSTNLEKLDDIDAALLRPGRCYAVINFRKLNCAESIAFCKDHNITNWSPTPGEEYSLAQLYNHTKQARRTTTKRRVGFY